MVCVLLHLISSFCLICHLLAISVSLMPVATNVCSKEYTTCMRMLPFSQWICIFKVYCCHGQINWFAIYADMFSVLQRQTDRQIFCIFVIFSKYFVYFVQRRKVVLLWLSKRVVKNTTNIFTSMSCLQISFYTIFCVSFLMTVHLFFSTITVATK